MNKHRIISALLAILMVVLGLVPAAADNNIITISSKKDFINFSQKCTLDTWSKGKTVNLGCDIDLSGEDFAPVPIFGGKFYGRGHTVFGIKFTNSGSKIGLFNYSLYLFTESPTPLSLCPGPRCHPVRCPCHNSYCSSSHHSNPRP